jgi:hypothetical protein
MSEKESADRKAIESGAQNLLRSADNFKSITKAVLWLGLIGAEIYVIVGLVPTCPPLEPGCYESDKGLFNGGSVGVGIGMAISVAWLYFASMTYISRAELAAAVASKK